MFLLANITLVYIVVAVRAVEGQTDLRLVIVVAMETCLQLNRQPSGETWPTGSSKYVIVLASTLY